MFDALSSQFLREAPELDEISPEDLPRILTHQYAELVSMRLRTGDTERPFHDFSQELSRIADIYEIISSSNVDQPLKKASAFVSGSAHLILAKNNTASEDTISAPLFDRDKVAPAITSGLLFLISEQYADANEAGFLIPNVPPESPSSVLVSHLRDLIQGKVNKILERSQAQTARFNNGQLENSERATQAISYTLCLGVELLAHEILDIAFDRDAFNGFATSDEAFGRIIQLASKKSELFNELGLDIETGYPGPLHLTSLLLELGPSLRNASLARLETPPGAREDFFKAWLSFRAATIPYIWKNHQEALKTNFHHAGQSAVLVLPTGAGKTTISTLKIADTLSRQKKVIFLAPTHALVEQVKDSLKEVFPRDQFGLDVSSDFDSLLLDEQQLQDIEVMTPEACLTMLSYTPESFNQVGLLVFDECHLLSPESGRIGRSLDGMLCVLTFHALAPNADLLFLSAMLRNSSEFSQWISELTQRECLPIDLLWKPSRQARGVVVYEQDEITSALGTAINVQNRIDLKKKPSKSVRAAARKFIKSRPFALWGLENNWLNNGRSTATTLLLEEPVQLNGAIDYRGFHANPNANHVAEEIAARAARNNLKTIVFVNRKDASVSSARGLAANLGKRDIRLSEDESKLWSEIEEELGGTIHSHIDEATFSAVPHNSSMLRIERMLAERLFSRKGGAAAIVATPTLAQGLNLPAHLAILAGDRRSSEGQDSRESLATHEILNAAARAGRAGHLANGAVLLIPEPIMVFQQASPPGQKLKEKLSALLPEDDRCVTITDPLERVLDQISEGELSKEAKYTLNRLASLGAAGKLSTPDDYLLPRSFGAFLARKGNTEAEYFEKVRNLATAVSQLVEENPNETVLRLASYTGLPTNVLNNLISHLRETCVNPPASITEWLEWSTLWLSNDPLAREALLGDVKSQIMIATGNKANAEIAPQVLEELTLGLKAWIIGQPIDEIEEVLGGDPTRNTSSRYCPRSRALITSVIPRSISYLLGVVARSVQEMDLYGALQDPDPSLIDNMANAVRKGVDSVEKLEFWSANNDILSRVRLHKEFDANQSNPSQF